MRVCPSTREGSWADARTSFERALAEEETPEALEGPGWAGYCLDDVVEPIPRRTGLWRGMPRLASGSLVEEIERLRGEPGDGEIGIGGATLAGEAAQLGLIDEFRAVVYPVLVGGGSPFYPQCERRLDLELIESRTFSSRVVYLLSRGTLAIGGSGDRG